MKPVIESRHGAYLGIDSHVLGSFRCRYHGPHFDVYDSSDNTNRLILVKSSRMPDDEDLVKGVYGIDFNRPKPELPEAMRYAAALPQGYQWLNGNAFAAGIKEEYEKKASVWDAFYSYIWGNEAQTVWVAPHSGGVNRAPDDVLRFPELMIDSFTAGITAFCALKNTRQPLQRIMIAIHSTGHLGGVVNLGDFGILDKQAMKSAAACMEAKYHDRAQTQAEAFKREFSTTMMKVLAEIQQKRGTLDPEELRRVSYDDYLTVRYYEKGLALYRQPLAVHSLPGFQDALQGIAEIQVPVVTVNYFYTGRNVARLLGLPQQITAGQMGSALVVECSRTYSANDPDLVSDIILDVKNELFSGMIN